MREFSSCSCLTALPGLAWVLLSKTFKPFRPTQYITSGFWGIAFQHGNSSFFAPAFLWPLTHLPFPFPTRANLDGWTRTGSLFCAAELAPNSKETTKSRTEEEHEEGEGRTAWDGRRRQADRDRARSAFAPQPRVCLIKSLFPTAPPRPPRHGRGLRFACLSGKRIGRPGE